MASTIAALTAGGGGVATTADSSGNLNLLSGTTTVLALTATGIAVTGTLSASGVTTNAAGTAALPSITTTGDTNTGIFFPAADTIAFSEGGAEAMRIDSSGNVLVTSPAGLGYGTGSGGTVTQATSKATGVTLNKPTGQITMNGAALGSGVGVAFQVSNSLVTQNDTVITSAAYTGAAPNPANYRVEMTHVQTGIFNIRVTNVSGGSLSDALVINFAIIKGATS